MSHHAFYVAREIEPGVSQAYAFLEGQGLSSKANPNVTTLRYTNLTIDDVRRLIDQASQAPVSGTQKALVIAASRLFHEAQNAMLKLFEEPVPGTTLILIVPSEGILLPTLRSRLIPLPGSDGTIKESIGSTFILLSTEERKKYLDRIYNRSKHDKQEEKQEARREALELVQGLTTALYQRGDMELLRDLTLFTKTLHERSAPLKPIFEHLQLVLPKMKASSGG